MPKKSQTLQSFSSNFPHSIEVSITTSTGTRKTSQRPSKTPAKHVHKIKFSNISENRKLLYILTTLKYFSREQLISIWKLINIWIQARMISGLDQVQRSMADFAHSSWMPDPRRDTMFLHYCLGMDRICFDMYLNLHEATMITTFGTYTVNVWIGITK